ncbi:hypothetical protein ACB098_02G121000 [Castanea mollissima]
MIGADSQRRRFEVLLLVRAVLVDRVCLCGLSFCCFETDRESEKSKKKMLLCECVIAE